MNTKSTTIKNGIKLFHKLVLATVIISATSITGCKKDDEDNTPAGPTGTTIEISGDVTSSVTLTANNKYILKGFVYVKDGVVLTIEPGTLIKGDKATKGTLIIERGAQIMAVGTATKPIVFTSNQPAGSRSYGDWGGVIICGRAPINLPGGEATIEGGTNALFGGTNPADNSGKMKYVRIEFCGIAFQPNQEINGLTMGGVGSSTEISYIQVSYSGDDSYEWFGGSANATNLVAFRGWDDDFDTDNGFSGKIQFAVGMRDKDIADQSGSNGFESDNDGQGTLATPNTKPIFSNITIFGPMNDASTVINGQFKRGAHLRRSTQICIYNSVIAGYPDGLFVDGSTTETNAAAGDLQFRNNIIAGCTNPLVASVSFDIQTWYNTPGYGNSVLTNSTDIQCGYPLNLTSPSFIPAATSPLLSGADFSNANLSGMQTVTYKGAFGTTDWTQGWCNFDPQNTAY